MPITLSNASFELRGPAALPPSGPPRVFMRVPPLSRPHPSGPMIGGRDILGSVTHRVPEVDQNFVERRGRLMPLQLLNPVRRGGFPGPQFPQRCNVRLQLLQGGVEAGGGAVNLLANRAFDLVEFV